MGKEEKKKRGENGDNSDVEWERHVKTFDFLILFYFSCAPRKMESAFILFQARPLYTPFWKMI